MDAYYERLIVSAATIDELLSDDFEAMPGDADLAARRLDAWCRSAAGGDRSLFVRRLERDGWAIDQVLARFAGARAQGSRRAAGMDRRRDLDRAGAAQARRPHGEGEPCAFEQLLLPVADDAEALLWPAIDPRAAAHLTASARDGLRHSLLKQLSELSAPAIYERFAAARKTDASGYDQFIAGMKAGEVLRLFEDKPVLLRADGDDRAPVDRDHAGIRAAARRRLAAIRRDILDAGEQSRVAKIEGDPLRSTQ